ncbi:MaoC/PaaZ C-terminal domain-containing protein [Nocardioides sp. SOB77]|uniref:MaoC/PaaZ C-terminal domain-containing protein n=1 Tax=Nocardioides oceani TaxID=3058369 RepID=A0ABT8FC50_9ACTN|nr:MaoC/PaaZ C-terminal domain-containing protein [Nocardioides oceani]MDN4172150.1 MaoC/PaaZ C-terminal domain-containing protein [Nocardioides oceani]
MTAVGEVLPPQDVPLTRTMIVATAIASRDYQDVHHDPDLAAARGSRDIFMNILTSNALAERYVRDWAGPAARVRRIRIRLGVPNHPGDTMTLTGEVASVDGPQVEVAVRGENSLGTHLSGSVTVEVPEEQA